MNAFPGVIGFLTADQVPLSDRRNGHWIHGVADREAFRKIQTGYACGECLAEFNMYMAVCPVCKTARDVAADVRPDTQGWNDYWDQHLNGTGDGAGGPTQVRGPEEFLRDLHNDPDVDQVKLSQLKPSKWGRGKPDG